MSLLFDYMCMRLPFIPWSIAGVPSSQALSSFLDTAPPSVLVPVVLDALQCGFKNKTTNCVAAKRLASECGGKTFQKKKSFIVLCL